MALDALLQCADVRVTALLTTVTEGYERISMHGVRQAVAATTSAQHRIAAARGADTAGRA